MIEIDANVGTVAYSTHCRYQANCGIGLDSYHGLPSDRAGKTRQGHRNLFRRIVVVLQPSGLIVDVRLHVEMPVPTEIEKDGLLLAFFLCVEGLAQSASYGMVCFGRRQDAFRSSKLNPSGERIKLLHAIASTSPR